MAFPRNRFALAGATPAELDALEVEHSHLTVAMRASNEHHFDELDTDGLRQALEIRRGAGLDTSETVEPAHDVEKLFEDMTVKELKAHADTFGLEIPSGANKAEIVALFKAGVENAELEPEQDETQDTEPDDVDAPEPVEE
jgi:hypothetical protein